MKNTKNKIITLILTTFVLFASFSMGPSLVYGGGETKSQDIPVIEDSFELFDEIQNEISRIRNNIEGLETSSYPKDSYNREMTFNYEDYPENYAGSYIKGNQVIVLEKRSQDSTYSITNNIDSTIKDSITVIPAKYSYNELNYLMNDLNLYKKHNNDSISDMFNLYWLDEENNRIVVELEDLNENNIKLFKENVSNSSAIHFKQIEGSIEKEALLKSGDKIGTTTGNSSISYRAKMGNDTGIVVSGHAAKYVGNGFYLGSQRIGSVKKVKISGPVDAAFVKTISGFTPSNQLQGSGTYLSTSTINPGVGTYVNMRGFKTGHSGGNIKSTNVTITLDGDSHWNLSSANYTSAPGDSGGIIYSYVQSTNTRHTVGTHVAAVGSTRYYSKALEINSALGVSRY